MRKTIVVFAAGLVTGGVVGFSVAVMTMADGGRYAAVAGTGSTLRAGARLDDSRRRRVATLEERAAREASNAQVWVQLGNEYAEAHEPERALEAYAKALQLVPNDPDVITDQGVMYRELGAYDEAIARFEQASRVAPHHARSLYNLGVVYAYDRKDVEKAIETWSRVVATAPGSPQAAEARQQIVRFRSPPTKE